VIEVVLDKPIHLVIFRLKANVERAKRIFVGETIFEDRMNVDSRVTNVAGRGGFEFAENGEQGTSENERSAKVIKTICVTVR